MDGRQQSLARFYRRREGDTRGWQRAVRQIVADGGDTELLASMYDQLTSVLAARPQITVLASTEGAVAADYQLRVNCTLPAPMNATLTTPVVSHFAQL
jgi:hypothetical protein